MTVIEHSGHHSTPKAQNGLNGALTRLRLLEDVFCEWRWPDQHAFVQARERAHEHAIDVLDESEGHAEPETALLVAATELIGALRVELAASPGATARLLARLEQSAGIGRVVLAREVLRAPELLAVSPQLATEVQLGLLVAFAPLRNASLWTPDAAGRVRCVRHVGSGRPSRGAATLARRLLGGVHPERGPRRLLLGFALGPSDRPLAALVGCANHSGARERCRGFMADALPLLSAIVERELLLTENVASERALVEASERKLTRLGFDLHDGPIQDVAVLAQDLRLFREQLEDVVVTRTQKRLVYGRLEDFDAQLVALDAELRRLSGEVQAASVPLVKPFAVALRERIHAFAARTGIEPQLALEGDPSLLSTSQQIALLNIVQEALSNIREHARASRVTVTVSARDDGVEAIVEDDGRGFDVEPTLMRAARDGRIGLVAINERVRLLGGSCRIDSRPGGPTVVSVSLDRWEPPAEHARPAHAVQANQWAGPAGQDRLRQTARAARRSASGVR
jgi:signal transduction histidine kinase